MDISYHNPVLLELVSEYLLYDKNGVYVDCTFGGGGHSKKFLKILEKKAKLIAFDQDQDSYKNLINDERFLFICENFRYLKKNLNLNGINKVNGIFLDLGVSSYQFDTPMRGFSTRFNAKLDMRMNANQPLSAWHIVNQYHEKKLIKIFFKYGELKHARKIAEKICITRNKKTIETTNDLKSIFEYIPKIKKNKILAKIFQAIRIEVNDELNALKELLLQSQDILDINSRLLVISYHSLEDRLVKKFIKSNFLNDNDQYDIFGNSNSVFKSLTKKPITPDIFEIKNNNRSRSAKLRVAKKIKK